MIARRHANDAGFTLVETLVTVVVVGITFAIFVGGMGSAVLTADYHRKHADARATLRNFAEAIKAAPYDANCATAAASYSTVFAPVPPSRRSARAVVSGATTHAAPGATTQGANAKRLNFVALAAGTSFMPPSGTTELWDAASPALTATASDQAVPVAAKTPSAVSTSLASGNSVTQTVLLESASRNPNSIVRRAGTTSASATAATALSIAKPSGTLVGDTMIAQIALRGGDSSTITAPSGWTLISSHSNGIAARSLVYQRSATTTAAATFTWTVNAATELAGGIVAYGGVASLFTASITGFQMWNGSIPATAGTFVNCPVSDNGLQKITLQVVALDTRAIESVVVVKRRP